jgi:hypothetical protein
VFDFVLFLLQEEGSHPPRLFQISNASGNAKAEELFDFVQVCLHFHPVFPLVCLY